jgi:hypothetical protein
MRREILTGILGLVSTVLALGAQTGNSPKIINLNDTEPVIFIEEVSPVKLGFDTAMYLPADFNAYAHPQNFMDISFIEEEDEVQLDFDVQEYLPRYFDPYKKYFDLNTIEYIEEEEEIKFNFEIRDYLPQGFSAVPAS